MRGQMNVNQSATNKKEARKKLIKYIKPYLPLIIIALLVAAISAVLIVIGPDKLKEITNIISNQFEKFADTHIWEDIDLAKITNIATGLRLFAKPTARQALTFPIP